MDTSVPTIQLPFRNAVIEDLVREIQDVGCGSDVLSWLMECVESKNGAHKVLLVNKISLRVQKSCSATSRQLELCCRVLVHLYLEAESGDVIKRAIARSLQTFPKHHHSKVTECLERSLRHSITSSSDSDRRHLVDNISSCLDNFNLGIQCISEMDVDVLKFLTESIQCFALRLQKHGCPTDLQKACLDCQSTVKTLTQYLQKAEKGGFLPKPQRQILSDLFDVIIGLLIKEENSLDCRCNCGMALSLLLRLFTDHTCRFYSSIFSESDSPIHPLVEAHNENGSLLSHTSSKALSELSSTSTISLILGLLSTLDDRQLSLQTANESRDILFFHVIFSSIISITKEVKESSLTIITSRAMLLWTKRAKEMLEIRSSDCALREKFQADGSISCQLLEYIWTHWDHFIDSVRHGTKDILDNVISIHILSFDAAAEAYNSPFIEWLFTSLVKMPSHHRGKYGALCCLIRHFGTAKILELQPTLPEDLLKAMNENAMQSHAIELFETLFTAYKAEMRASQRDETEKDWNSVWVMPVIKGFNIYVHTSHLEHLICKLFKCSPNSLNFVLLELVTSDSESINDSQLRALLVIAKTARSLGIISSCSSSDDNLYTGSSLFPPHILKQALSHIDDDIRIDALVLLCDCPKTTGVIPENDLDLILQFLHYNTTNQSPKFRQKLLAQIKKLILRISESGQSLKRQLNCIEKKDPNSEDKPNILICLFYYQRFLDELIEQQLDSLYNSANFPRRGIALGILKLLRDIIGFKFIDDVGMSLKSFFKPQNVQTLLECLKDTYEENKEITLDLLKELDSHQLAFDDYDRVLELFETSLQMASSIRPQDEITASYIFRLLIHHPLTLQACDTVKRLYDEDAEEISYSKSNSFANVVFSVLEVLTIQLKIELSVAKENILEAASNGPMHGLIFCIKTLLMELDFKQLLTSQDKWQSYLTEIVDLSLEICNVVKPIVNNASPEGFFPIGTDEDTDVAQTLLQNLFKNYITSKNEGESGQVKSRVQAKTVTSQMLLLCGWRTMKEVSLLLGEICQKSIEILTDRVQTPVSPRLLLVEQIVQVGDFFITLLTETIHRGAFEQAYMGFKKLCDGLSKSPVLALYRLPEQWLSDLFEHIQTGTRGSSTLCSTRRSAGIPFMVQALVSTGADVHGSNCFKNAMSTLLQVGLSSSNCQEQSKVHAFNILRALFRDTRLGEEVTSFVAEGLHAAILGFKAKTWAVRNSATLLFSALVTRIFGVKRSKDELSKKNCMTGNIFFQRYPNLYQFLLSELKEANDCLNSSSSCVLPSLYPVLMVLARLYPSSMEGTQSSLKLSSFVPYVMNCSRSAIYKTRVLAAKALVPLVALEDLVKVVEQLLEKLPKNVKETHNHNTIHGVLLQLNYVLEEISSFHFMEQNLLKDILRFQINEKQWLLTKQNVCPVTRISFLQLIDNALSLKLFDNDFSFANQMLKTLENELSIPKTELWFPAYEMLLVETANIYLRLHLNLCQVIGEIDSLKQLEHCICHLLRHWSYEVRLATLRCLYEAMSGLQTTGQNSESSDLTRSLSMNIPIRDWKVSADCHILIQNSLKSKQIINCLLNMISNEVHPECLAQLCCLLPAIPNIYTFDWYQNENVAVKKTATEKLELILLKGECEPRDDIRCALLHLLSFLIPEVFEEIKLLACFPRRASVCENVSPPLDPRLVMNEWTEAFLICCSPEQSVRLRLTATHLLVRNCSHLLLDPDNALGPSSSSIWSAVILLLQDDEPYIRYNAARIVEIFHQKTIRSIQPEMALDVILNHFVTHFGQYDTSSCLTMLLDWMLKQNQSVVEAIEDEDEFKMFDRGQMNIYCEEINTSNLIGKHLASILEVAFKSTLNERDDFGIDNVSSMVLEELNLAVENLEPIFTQSPFLSFCYDASVVRLYRVMNAAFHLCKLVDQKDDLKRIQLKMKSKLNSGAFYNRLLCKVSDSFEALCV